MRREWVVVALLPAGLLVGERIAPAEAQEPVPVGGEFQVNSSTYEDQFNPDVSRVDASDFVVVWTSDDSSGTDGSYTSIQGQRFDAGGVPLGGEFQVNSSTFFYQEAARVSPDGSGGFVVVWHTSYEGQFFFGVHGQRYDSAGAAVDGEFQLDSNTAADEALSPAVAPLHSGSFITVWTSRGSFGTDSSGRSIQARRYDADGTPAGPEFQINTSTLNDQGSPAVSPDPEGGYIVVWHSDTSSGTDGSEESIQGQRFDSADSPLGPEFQVNTYTTGRQWHPDVAPWGEGGFVVVWESYGSSGADMSGKSVQGQRFDAGGAPLGPEFQVNTYTTDNQDQARLAPDGAGGFVVVWTSSGSHGTDSDGPSIQGQRFAANGSPLGGEFQINTFTTSIQSSPALSFHSSGRFAAAWRSFGSSGTDSDSYSVQGQRYAIPDIFADGFESGDTTAWSSTVP